MRRRAVALAFALAVTPALAQTAAPEGDPVASNALKDAEFGVASTAFGLERRVEMYQWRPGDDGGYDRVWAAGLIDSDDFDAAHRNPRRLPVRNRSWWVDAATLDGRPLPLDVVRLLGRWQVVRPNFSRLPGRYAARYQPEGDGLSSADNPLAPDIGDVRITWHELVLPPLAGKVELHEDAWRLSPKAAAAPAAARPAVDIAAVTRKPARLLSPWVIALAVGALVGLWFLTRALTGGKH